MNILIYQISVNDVQQYAAVLETVEQVSNIMGVCYIYEKLYLSNPVGPMLRLEESLKVLYMAILTALAKARRFYDSRTLSEGESQRCRLNMYES